VGCGEKGALELRIGEQGETIVNEGRGQEAGGRRPFL